MMKKSPWLCIIVMVCWSAASLVQATVIDTPASASARVITMAFEGFAAKNQGTVADSWEDFADDWFGRRQLEATMRGTLPERYSLCGMAGPRHPKFGTVVCISNQRIRDDREEKDGRYATFYRAGKFSLRWLAESEVVVIFQMSNRPLPDTKLWVQPSTRHVFDSVLQWVAANCWVWCLCLAIWWGLRVYRRWRYA